MKYSTVPQTRRLIACAAAETAIKGMKESNVDASSQTFRIDLEVLKPRNK